MLNAGEGFRPVKDFMYSTTVHRQDSLFQVGYLINLLKYCYIHLYRYQVEQKLHLYKW